MTSNLVPQRMNSWHGNRGIVSPGFCFGALKLATTVPNHHSLAMGLVVSMFIAYPARVALWFPWFTLGRACDCPRHAMSLLAIMNCGGLMLL